MNKLEEKKLRRIIRNILIEAQTMPASMFAQLADSPGGKALSSSMSNKDNSAALISLISSLKLPSMQKEIIKLYGEKGRELNELLSSLSTKSSTSIDPDPTIMFKK